MSLWQEGRVRIETDPVPPFGFGTGQPNGVVIAGAGLTGLVSALLFARAGRQVTVIESRQIGAVTTGNSTAKLSLLQGTHLGDILAHAAPRVARAYLEANREGMEWLLRYCDEHSADGEGISVQRRDAYTYASTPDGTAAVEREYRAARRLGLPVVMDDAKELPFPTFGAVRLADQAQLDPMDLLAVLAADVRRHGGVIHEGVRLLGARASKPVEVRTSRGTLLADRLILATGTPVLDRALYFAKLVPKRSYAMAFSVPGRLPSGMYLSADLPGRSLRTAFFRGEERLIVGGNGHITGRAVSPRARYDDLERWTRQYFPGAEPTNRWSAQDYESAGRIPFVGWLPRGRGRIFLATGYDKWGMANAVAAGLTLAGDILGGNQPWARTLHRRVTTPMDAASFIGANAAVVVELVRGYLNAWRTPPPRTPPLDGEAIVSHDGVRPVGVSMVDGVRTCVVAICPHLGGVLGWNDAELSWDCPLHGSRFAADGSRLEGPAKRDLTVLRPADPDGR